MSTATLNKFRSIVSSSFFVFISFFSFFAFFFFSPSYSFANNLSISSYGPNQRNVNTKTVKMRFKVDWDNSWRLGDGQHDAVWMFIKFYDGSVWRHATMQTAGINPEGTAKSSGCPYDIVVPADKKGFFVRRNESNIACCTAAPAGDCDYFEVTWAYGEDQILYNTTLDFSSVSTKLFGVEMVYIPQGPFYVGDGTSSDITGQFEDATSGDARLIDSEDALTLGGGGSGSLGNNNASTMFVADDFDDSTSVTLPATFPKGYNAFYVMKYEITQAQYRDFLNTLTYDQQETRTASAPSSAAGTGALSTGNSYRNGLDIKTAGTDNTVPAVYGCNLDGDATYDEADDGQGIACNYLSWADVAAYADWSGLRPFTELEFEKACRGPLTAVANEYAWGTATIASASYSLSNSGAANETTSANYSTTSGNALYTTTENNFNGPCRVGMFAGHTSNTGRVTAGAGYYGVMELNGNLEDRPVTVGNVTGRAFTGIHGNGILDSSGNADVALWPGIDAVGAGMRGSGWNGNATRVRVSDRNYAGRVASSRSHGYGGRAVRSAP